jgi:AAA15 family ATPase/GTPase
MIDSLHIKNFRGFRDLSLSGLRSINIVVGKNASGKTALLEAIRVGLSGTPQALWHVNQSRMAGFPIPMGPSRESFENIWSSDFFNLDSSQTISFEFHDSSEHTAKLTIFYDTEKAITSIPEQPSASPSNISPLVFERVDFAGKESRLLATVQPQGHVQMDNGAELGMVSEFHTSYNPINGQQNAAFFSLLSINNREREIVEAMKEEFAPLIEDLMVLSPQNFPSLYVVVSGLKDKVPISLLSSGINKLFAILAAMVVRSGGVFLIDEIDNGFYYDRLESIWRILHKLSTKYHTQVFASTHSKECLHALSKVIKGQEKDFVLLRAEHDSNGSQITPIDGRFLESAIEHDFEVR